MYYYPFQYPAPWHYRIYPPVDVTVFSGSVKSFSLLMQQGSLLLNRLADARFAYRLMDAAQKGNQPTVDSLIKSIGLKVPVTTRYTPSGVLFELTSPASGQHPVKCCTLTLFMKWRNQ